MLELEIGKGTSRDEITKWLIGDIVHETDLAILFQPAKSSTSFWIPKSLSTSEERPLFGHAHLVGITESKYSEIHPFFHPFYVKHEYPIKQTSEEYLDKSR